MTLQLRLLATTAFFLSLNVPTSAQGLTKPGAAWPQTHTARAADPAIRFGQLPNGLRYAILHNATPPGQMSLRLYIGSGSMAEADDQRGLAHFLEHMAFRGSAHVPDGEMTRILARHGLSFGADTNAATSQEATVYQLDFPKAEADDIDTGLMLFHEIADRLTLASASTDAERGVILSEERLRDTPAYRATKASVDFLLPGQLAPQRWPIGSNDIIAHATPDQLRRFYEANYRPDNAVIVAVGDFDAVAMEAKIKTQFADWKATGPLTRQSPGTVAPRQEEAKLFSEAGAPQQMQLAWVRPYDTAADTDQRELRDDVRAVAAQIFNHRLEDIAARPDAPFVGARLDQQNLLKSADLTTLGVIAPAEKWQSAVKAVVNEQQRAMLFGVTQAEIDRAMSELRAYYTAVAAGAATRETPKLAAAIVKNVNDGDVTRSPQQDLAEIDTVSRTLSIASINAALKDAFQGSGPLLYLSAPQPPAGGEQALRAVFDAALKDKVVASQAAAALVWPYAHFGTPGRVVERKEVTDLGLTFVRFANGTRLTVKPTAFAKDQVLTAIGSGAGRLGLPADRARAYWLVNGTVPAFLQGGTGKLSIGDIQRVSASHNTNLQLALGMKRFELIGQTQPADLDFELQLATGYLSDPGFRPEAVARFRAGLAAMLPQIDATAPTVLQREKAMALHGGDQRWTSIPLAGDLAATTPEDLRALLPPALSSGDMDVVIVGDTTVDRAIQAVGETIGSLPNGSPVTKPGDWPEVRFPAPATTPVQKSHNGRADQAVALVAWPTRDFFADPAEARALSVATEIVKQRLIDQLRESDGATYSPAVEASASQELPGYGYLAASVEIPPAKLGLFEARLTAILADLGHKQVSDDELSRAKTPLMQNGLREKQANGYWLTALFGVQDDPRLLDAVRTREKGINAVTGEDVEMVAQKYLVADKRYTMEIVSSAVGKQ